MTEVIVRVDPAPVFDIDPAHIGRVLVCLIAESANLGHAAPRSTLHYGAPDGEPEAAQFVRDAFTLNYGRARGEVVRRPTQCHAVRQRDRRSRSSAPAEARLAAAPAGYWTRTYI